MSTSAQISTNPLIAKIHQLFSRDLALENDFLGQEKRILRSKLPTRVPLTEADRLVLVQFGLPIKARLAEVVSYSHAQSRIDLMLSHEVSRVYTDTTSAAPDTLYLVP